MKINLNSEIKFKLNEHGWVIYNAHWNVFGISPPEIVKIDGYCYMQLWDYMNVFGKHLHNGCKLPFEVAEFELVEDEG